MDQFQAEYVEIAPGSRIRLYCRPGIGKSCPGCKPVTILSGGVHQPSLPGISTDKAQQVEPYAVFTQGDCYMLRYRRLADGVPFDPDGFEITVEPVAGLVRSSHLTWNDIRFAPRDKVMSAAEAEKCFLAQFPLQLGYYVPVELAIEEIGLNEQDEHRQAVDCFHKSVSLAPFLAGRGRAGFN